MNKPSILISFLCLLTLGLPACTSMRKANTATVAPKPRADIHAEYLKPDDIRRVRTGEFVKTYHVGRSVTGRRGGVLHEAHRAYRLEKANRWNLNPMQPPLASVGPTNRVVDTAFKPAPSSKAIRAELKRQKAVSEELEATSNAFTDAVIAAKSQLGQSQQSAAALAGMRQEVSRLERENQALKQRQPTVEAPPEAESPSEALRRWGKNLGEKSDDSEAK